MKEFDIAELVRILTHVPCGCDAHRLTKPVGNRQYICGEELKLARYLPVVHGANRQQGRHIDIVGNKTDRAVCHQRVDASCMLRVQDGIRHVGLIAAVAGRCLRIWGEAYRRQS